MSSGGTVEQQYAQKLQILSGPRQAGMEGGVTAVARMLLRT